MLIDESTGLAPRRVTVKRIGKDLHIGLDGASADEPQVIIEDYYGSSSQLVGEAEGGQYYDYVVSSSADGGAELGALTANVDAPVGLSQSGLVPGFAETMAAVHGAGSLGLGTLGALGAVFAVPVAAFAGGIAASAGGRSSGDQPELKQEDQPAPPAAPSLTGVYDDNGAELKSIPDGGYTDDETPVFKGTGQTAGDTIEIRFGNEIVGRTTVGADGTWSLSLSEPLSNGNYTFSIVEIDASGRASDSIDYSLTVDTSPPSRPLIDRVIDNADPHVGIVNRQDVTNDDRPTIEGRGKIGSIIYIYDNGGTTPIGSVAIGDSGTWSFRVPESLADGNHSLTAKAVDRLGRESAPSRAYEIAVDTTPPEQPTIGEVVDHVGPIQGALDNHSSTDDPNPALSGNAEAGSIVTIYDGDTKLGSTVADQEGHWSFTPSQPLADGEHVLTVRAEDKAGNTSQASDPFTIDVDTTPPAKPTITDVIDNTGDVTGPLEPHDTTDDARPEIKGSAEAQSVVLIYDTVFGKQVLLGSVRADADGHWSFRPPSPLPEGDHELSAIARDAAGNESELSDGFDFTLQIGGVPVTPSITGVFDAVEPQIGNVEKYGVTNDAQPTVTGTAPANSIVRIFVDGKIVASVTADGFGRWNYRPETPLTEGSHSFSASAQTADGKVTPSTGDYSIVVDTVAPDASKDETLLDDVGNVTGPIANGATTDDATPVYSGKAEAGAVVTIYDGDKAIGSTVAGQDGRWTFRPSEPLSDGAHRLSTTVTDKAGNTSERGDSHEFTVDTGKVSIALDQVIDHVGTVQGPLQPGQTTDDRQPEVTGKAKPGSLVKVYVDGEVVGSVQAGSDGQWSLKLPVALSEGPHEIAASSTANGVESALTEPFELTVDVTAPDRPTIESAYDDVGAVQGPIANHGVTDDTTPTLRGSAEPGAVVTIYDGGKAIGSTVANAAGGWSFTPGTPLADGEHDFTVTARDAAGNESGASEVYAIKVDTSGPGTVVITDAFDDQLPQTGSVSNGGFTNDTRPTLHGTAKPGSIVTIRDGNTVLGSTMTDASGKWSFTPDSAHALTEGKHALTAQSKDAAGAQSAPSQPYELNIDLTPPGKPSLEEVIDNVGNETGPLHPHDTTDDTQPTLRGTAEQNSIVMIYDVANGTKVLLGSTRADVDGHWSFRPASSLPEGTHTLSVIAKDAAGNESEPSDGFDFTLQVGGVPSAPSITGVFDAVEPQVGNVAPNGETNDTRPTVSGTAQPGHTVHVFVDGKEVGIVIAGDNGRWSYRPETPLAEGEHAFSAKAESPDGKMSPSTGDYSIVVDTIAPDASKDETLLDDVGNVTGPIANGATTDDATPVYSGKAEAGAVVTIYDGDKAIGSTVAGQDGRWTFRPSEPLSDGAHRLSTTVTDKAGNTSERGDSHEFTVDTGKVSIALDQVIDHVGTVQGPLQPGQTTDDRQPEVTGKAKPGSLVKVYVDGEVVGSVQAGSDGQWSLKLPVALSEGPHEIAASSTANGVESALTEPFELTVDVTAPDRPTIESAYDDVGAVQGPIANHGVTDDTTPTLRGSAEPGAVVTIYDGGKAIGSTVANAAGGWSFTPGTPLADGEHDFTVTARDAAGNESDASQSFNVTVDTSAPARPSIVEVIDNVGNETGPLHPHDTTDDTQPTLRGTAEQNSIVMIYDVANGTKVLLGSTRADVDGHWSFRPASSLPEGTHTLSVIAKDAAGNESEPSDGFDFTLQVGGVPSAPSITGVFDAVEPQVGNVAPNGETNDTRPTVSGTAQPGHTVHVFVDGKEVGIVIAGDNGRWSYRPETPLAEGEHAFSAKAESPDGKMSPSTGDYSIVVDTIAPDASKDETLLDDVGNVTGPIANGATTDDATPVYSGKAEAGAVVTIYDGDKAIGSTVAGQDGRWTFRPSEPLSDGAHRLSTTVTDKAGNTSERGDSHEFTVDTGKVSIALDQVIDHVGTVQGPLQPGQTTDDRQPEVTGKAKPGSLVKVYVDGEVVGSVQAGSDGQWSLKLPVALSEGPHEIAASSTANGVESALTEPFELTVDVTAPDRPTIESAYDDVGAVQGPIANHGVTDDTTPTLRGSAEPGAVVTIYDGGKAIGSTVANAAGGWSFTPGTPLADGEHDFTVTARDAAGNESDASQSFTIHIDTSDPGTTVITYVFDDVEPQTGWVSNGGFTNDTRPTVYGTAKPGSIVTIRDGDTVLGSTMTDASGNWSFTPDWAHALAEGRHDLTAQSKDSSGTMSDVSPSFVVNVDTTPPDAPVIADVIDNFGDVTGSVHPGETTDDRRPTLNGTAEPGSTVLIFDRVNGTNVFLGSVHVSLSGYWSFRPDTSLDNGRHAFLAKSTDAAGNTSAISGAYEITVLQGVPSAPSITGVTDAVEPQVGNIEPNGATNDAQPTVKGTALPGQIVHVFIDGKEVGTTISTAAGQWSYRPTMPLPDGEHTFSATAEGADGQSSKPTGDYPIVVDTIAPSASTGEMLIDDVGPATGPIANGATTDDATPTYRGKAEAGALVTIYDGDQAIGSTVVNADGTWSFHPTAPLADGAHRLSTTVTDRAGNVSGHSKPIEFTVDTSNVVVAIDQVIDHVGSLQGPLQSGQSTDDQQPEIRGKANGDAIVKIYVDGQFVTSLKTGADGRWSLKLPVALSEGPHEIAASSTANGVESALTEPFELTVDVTAPDRPAIDSVHDDVGVVQGRVENNGYTDDSTPTLKGHAERGSLVTIYDGSRAIGSTFADANGNWTFTPSRPLTDGTHVFTVTARDAAGNTSQTSEGFTLHLDTSAPNPPVIMEVIDAVGDVTGPLNQHDTTDDAQPLVNGTAEKNSLVLIYDTVFGTRVLIGSARADASGHWSFRPDAPVAPLTDGDHHLTAVATDAPGNESAQSAGFDFTVLVGGVPTAPSISGVFDAVEPHVGNIGQSGVTNDPKATVTGTAPAGQIVHVFIDANEVGSVKADASGRWWFRPDAPLADGEHRWTAIAETEGGEKSVETGAYTIIVDTTAPAASTDQSLIDDVGALTGAITNGTVTDDATPTYGGKAEPGAIVTIFDGDKAIGSTVVEQDGTWRFHPAEPLADGKHAFSTTVTDPAGNTSERSETTEFMVDTSSAGVIAIHEVMDSVGLVRGALQPGQSTDDRQPVVDGLATPNSLVTVYVDGKPAGSTYADADGAWSLKLPELSEGAHDITATSTTPASGESKPTEPFTLTVDTTAPDVSTNEKVTDHVGAVTGQVEEGGVTDDATPVFSGKAEPGAVVTIFDGDKAIGSTVVDADGTWRYRPTEVLADGNHSLSTTVTDAAGNMSERSPSIGFTVDTSHVEIAIGEVIDHVGTVTGALQPGQTTDDVHPEVTGKATPDSLVRVYVDGKVAGSVIAGADGTWSLKITTALTEGSHGITATTTTDASGESVHTAPFDLIIDTTPPAVSTNEKVTDHVGAVTGQIEAGGVTDDAAPVFSGKAEPGAVVTIFDGDKAIGSTVVDADGTWRYRPTEALTDGDHSLSTTVTDAAGNTSAHSASTEFTVDTKGAGVSIAIDEVVDHVGTVTGALQPGQTTDDVHPQVTGKATPDSLVRVYVDGKVAGSVIAGADGAWSLKLETALTEGDHAITATTTTDASGESAQTEPFTLTVDLTPPAQPTIDAVTDDVGAQQGTIADGAYTDDKTPTLSGKAEANSIVTVYDGETVLGSTIAAVDGTWTYTPIARLTDGEHVFTVIARDAAGNSSETSGTYTVHVDTLAPDSPKLEHLMDDVGPTTGDMFKVGLTDDSMPMFSGKAEPGSIVMLYSDYEGEKYVLGSARATATGEWSIVPAMDMDDGVHRITMTATDKAGNVGAPSEPYLLEVDTTAPDQPTITDIIVNVDGVTGSLGANGGTTMDHRPQIVGLAEAGATITVMTEHGGVLGTTHADATGHWTFMPDTALADGSYVISVTATDAAGNPSARSTKVTIEIEPSQAGSAYSNDVEASTDSLFGGEHDVASHAGGSPALHEGRDAANAGEVHEASLDVTAQESRTVAANGVPAHGEHSVLAVDGGGQTLDLSTLLSPSLPGAIDAIDLSGSGANTLKLSLGDVLQHGSKDLFVDDGRTQLMVKGDAHDVVDLSGSVDDHGGEWIAHGETMVDGVAYAVYENSAQNAELLVQHGVTTHLM
ncbi:hypothetical protein WS51_28410 [Burkholderia territorii]|nr:hypothetical protein WS51_28410 [Burkholderia territorii]